MIRIPFDGGEALENMTLCVNGKGDTIYAVFRLDNNAKAWEGCQ